HNQAAPQESGLAADQIKLPHAAELLAEFILEHLTVALETLIPGFQRSGIVQTPNLHVGQNQRSLLNGQRGFGERRNVATRENVLADPRLATLGGLVSMTNGMDQTAAALS